MSGGRGWIAAGDALCECGDGYYDSEQYTSCYDCYLERRADYVTCKRCKVRWHSPKYTRCWHCSSDGGIECIFCGRRHNPKYHTCFKCRPERENAGESLRLIILGRDKYTCRYCGSREDLQVDHVKPCSAGGNARPWNLQTLCGECNREKGNTWPGPYEQTRGVLLRAYFTHLRSWLDDEERAALRAEVEEWRRALRAKLLQDDRAQGRAMRGAH
jgi:5-methylcytosine-specific restriction endonuclease McrA